MIVAAWPGVHVGVNFVCHSRAMTSKVSVSSVSACFWALRTAPGSMPCGKLLSGFISSLPGIGKTDFRICAQGKQFFLSLKAIFEPPQLTARWSNQKKQTTSIKKLVSAFLMVWRFEP